jgi:hypothetical protein
LSNLSTSITILTAQLTFPNIIIQVIAKILRVPSGDSPRYHHLKSNVVKYKAGNLQAEYQSWHSLSEGYDNHHLIFKKISLHHSNEA